MAVERLPESTRPIRVAIVGAGALGSVIGGALAQGGADVTLVTRNRAHVEAVNRDGLVMRGNGGDQRVRLAAITPDAAREPVDLVIVLAKSFHTESALRAALALVGPDTTVISLQNGLGHEDTLAAIVGADKVIAGKTYVGGVLLAPGLVIAGVEGKETIVGELDGVVSPRVEALAATFRKAGLDIVVSDNIRGAMWDKLLVNVATGALAAVTRLTYGDLYDVPEIEATALAAVAEAMAVARAQGVALRTTDPREAWTKASAGLPAAFKTSMLQSLEKGSVTEVDYINGAVARAGARLGVPTPVNATLVACVKGAERALTATPSAAGAYLEHAAILVRDLPWHVRFFEAVCGWKVRQIDGEPDAPRQVWLGGAQLVAAPDFDDAQGRVHHLGVRCADVEAACAAALAFEGVGHLEKGRTWLTLPEGLIVELLPASAAAVGVALTLRPDL